MGLFSEFNDKLKVKTEDKRVRKYTYDDINIREDKETGNLELYIEETLSTREKTKGWSTARLRKRDTNVRNKKTLEGLHIVVGYRYIQNSEKFFLKCVEDENIKITIKDNGTLEIVKDGKKENVARVNYGFVSTGILERVSPGRYTSLGGYTLEAVRKVVEEYKKEKDNKREEK